MARLISPKRTKNVNELQVAVMQWELTLIEHESKFSEVVADSVKTAAMRAMLPKHVLERFLDGPFHYEELRNRVSAYVGEKLAGQDANGGSQPWTLGRSTSQKERTKMSMQFNSALARSIQPETSKSPTTSENPFTVGLPTRHHLHHANRLHVTRNLGVMRRNRVRGRRSVSFATNVMERAILPGSARQQMIARTWMKSEQSRPVMLTVICLVWIGDDTIATINSVTERNDKIRGGKEWLAFVDSGAVDNVLPKSVCTEYPLEATSKSQSGVGFKGANGSHIKHYGQRRFRVKTSAGSNSITTWEVEDVRKSLISASRLLERGHKLVLDEKPRIQCKNGDTIPLERTSSLFAVRLWIPKGFHRLNTNRIKKREPVRPHTEERTRNKHSVWPVTDASDRADVDMDEFADLDTFGEEVTDTVGTARVLAAPRTPTKAEREEHDVTHVPYRPWCRFCVMGRGLERRHLTQSSESDDDRPRMFADYGYLSGDSIPLLVARTDALA